MSCVRIVGCLDGPSGPFLVKKYDKASTKLRVSGEIIAGKNTFCVINKST